MSAGPVSLPPEQQVLKGATRALVRAFGGQEAAAVHLGRAQSRLSDWSSVNQPAFAPIDVVMALEGVTAGTPGWPHVTRAMAAATGHVLVRLPEAMPAEADVFGWVANLAKEAGEVQAELGRALADNRKVDAAEVPAIRAQIADLQALLAAMEAGLTDIERAG